MRHTGVGFSTSLRISAEMIKRLSPDSLSVMEFKSGLDVEIADKLVRYPLLGDSNAAGWRVKLANEFHMTNDSNLFRTSVILLRVWCTPPAADRG